MNADGSNRVNLTNHDEDLRAGRQWNEDCVPVGKSGS